jgi:inner membrane protein
MELITQGILGAAVSQAGFQRRLGRRAALWGAIIGLLPDADVIVGLSKDPFAEALYHRGFTHSLWFAPTLAPLLGYLLWLFYKRHTPDNPGELFSWIALSFWALITHPLLDVFTVYGTQLLSPFSNFRFCFPSIPIVEPIYSLTLLAGVIAALVFHKRSILACILVSLSLLLTSSYLFYGLEINDKAETFARSQLEHEGLKLPQLRVYTTLFTMDSRRVVLQTPSETRIGFISVKNPKPIEWIHIPKSQQPFLSEIKDTRAFQIFNWFTSNDYFVTTEVGRFRIHDARYGLPDPESGSLWGLEGELTPDNHLKGDLQWFRNRNLGNSLSNLKRNLLKPLHARK